MVKCVCANCNYRCELRKKSDCPYCGMDALEKEKTAGELIEEVEKLLE